MEIQKGQHEGALGLGLLCWPCSKTTHQTQTREGTIEKKDEKIETKKLKVNEIKIATKKTKGKETKIEMYK